MDNISSFTNIKGAREKIKDLIDPEFVQEVEGMLMK